MIDPERHAESRNPVESILRQIPGFQGYFEREHRRESDQLARNHLADELGRCKADLDHFQRSLADAGQLDALPQCERVRTRVDPLQSRIQGAMRGYSGFFDYVRVDEDVLDQVHEYDLILLEDMEGLRQKFQQLRSADRPAQPQPLLDELLQQVEAFHRRFDQRGQLLEGLISETDP